MADSPEQKLKLVRPTRDDAVKSHVGVPESELPPAIRETNWDKPAPEGPPGEPRSDFAPHLAPMIAFFTNQIHLDSILMDLCMKRSMDIVRKNVSGMAYGIDNVPMDGSNPTHPAHLASVAGPLCVELYKQAVDSVNKNPKEFQEALEKAKEILGGSKKTSAIITP